MQLRKSWTQLAALAQLLTTGEGSNWNRRHRARQR
jgi:hypothetical protein